jgi:hypothetical protein
MLCMAACVMTTGFAQTDSTKNKEADTIRIGGIIIIKKPGSRDREIVTKDGDIKIPRRDYKKENITTNWWIVDLGFSNYNDQTNYTSIATQTFAPLSTEDWFKLRAGKSRNVNIWFFMQRLNMIKHVVNLKYGMGLELNNYYFEEDIVFNKKPTLISMSATEFKKNKLAADYLTVPMMLNFNFTPDRREGFGFSGGISAGYLYSARHKTKAGDDKNKVRSDFDLKRWKVAYVGELLLGPVKLYGSYALDNMWDKGLDHTPYTVGFRLSNW